jgi:hypothetical protein
MTGPNDPDHYYLQPGHALSPDVDRFRVYDALKPSTPDTLLMIMSLFVFL